MPPRRAKIVSVPTYKRPLGAIDPGITQFSCKSCLRLPIVPRKPIKNPKMGAEKVTMNIVVVGQVQSAKASRTVAKATPATSQLMMNC